MSDTLRVAAARGESISAVYDPEGRPLDRAGAESPGIAVADLDATEVRRVQALNPVARDRLATLGERTVQVMGAR